MFYNLGTWPHHAVKWICLKFRVRVNTFYISEHISVSVKTWLLLSIQRF